MLVAEAGKVGSFCDGVLCSLVAGPQLRLTEPHEQVGVFGVGTMRRNGHVERVMR